MMGGVTRCGVTGDRFLSVRVVGYRTYHKRTYTRYFKRQSIPLYCYTRGVNTVNGRGGTYNVVLHPTAIFFMKFVLILFIKICIGVRTFQ